MYGNILQYYDYHERADEGWDEEDECREKQMQSTENQENDSAGEVVLALGLLLSDVGNRKGKDWRLLQ